MSHFKKRRINVIKPLLQLKIVGVFIGIATAMLAIQMALLALDLHALSKVLPAGQQLSAEIPGLLARSILFSAGLGFPAMVAIGLLTTFGIAGPIHHMERHLEEVIEGEDTAPIRLRKSDAFQELASLLNEAIETTRAEVPEGYVRTDGVEHEERRAA